jgi:DNA-damage-inducible protein D
MKKIGDKENYTNSIFENIKNVDEYVQEYLYARELSNVLEYSDWRNFLKVLNKAKAACENSGFNVDEQLVEVNKLSKRNN